MHKLKKQEYSQYSTKGLHPCAISQKMARGCNPFCAI